MTDQYPNPQPPPDIPRRIALKARLASQVMAGAEFPDAEGRVAGLLEGPQTIVANLERESLENSTARTLMRRHASPIEQTDIFDLPEKASTLVDALVGGVESPEIVDFVLAVHSFDRVANLAVEDWSDTTVKRQAPRLVELGNAFSIELASRMPFVISAGGYSMSDVYDRLFDNTSREASRALQKRVGATVNHYYNHVADRTDTTYRLLESSLVPPKEEGAPVNAYNKPLRPQAKREIDNTAADLIERLHLLKGYDVAPMVVPAASVGLEWDIAVLPPVSILGREEAEYDPGALADFAFLRPDENRTEALMKVREVEGDPDKEEIDVGGTSTQMRFRLHDNGQISFGRAVHNIPGDHVEALFAGLGAMPAFTRLRGLLIAIAFDVIADEKVVRQRVGGSVAKRFRELRTEAPRRETVADLLFPRLLELRANKVTPKNRQPIHWERPTQKVRGHRKHLPEGMRRRPEAEEEARKYYTRIGVEFHGLADDENFVKGYKRGTGPEDTTPRRAAFRGRSATARHLGNLGIR